MSNRINICGVLIDNVTMAEAVERIHELVRQRQPASVVTPNVDHVVRLAHDKEFTRVYQSAALVLADGMPLLWAGSFLGTPFREKVSGSDLLPALCPGAVKHGHSLFLFGGREGAAEAAAAELTRLFPGLKIAGTYCPPVGFEKNPMENEKALEAVRRTSPDILLVGLGSPKQEFWIARNATNLGVPVSIGIGVTFEFLAGMVRRAPEWMQKTGLEWSWRLVMEPKRLWKRYLMDDPEFFAMVWRQKIRRRA